MRLPALHSIKALFNWRLPVVIVILICLLGFLVPVYLAPAYACPVYEQPTQQSTQVGTLIPHEKIQVLSREENWVYVKNTQDTTGYVPANELRSIPLILSFFRGNNSGAVMEQITTDPPITPLPTTTASTEATIAPQPTPQPGNGPGDVYLVSANNVFLQNAPHNAASNRLRLLAPNERLTKLENADANYLKVRTFIGEEGYVNKKSLTFIATLSAFSVQLPSKGTYTITEQTPFVDMPDEENNFISVLKKGESFSLIGKIDPVWVLIQLQDGNVGYCATSDTSIPPPATPKPTVKPVSPIYAKVTSTAPFYTSPGASTPLLHIPKGYTLKLTGYMAPWYQTRYNGKTGYVREAYLNIIGKNLSTQTPSPTPMSTPTPQLTPTPAPPPTPTEEATPTPETTPSPTNPDTSEVPTPQASFDPTASIIPSATPESTITPSPTPKPTPKPTPTPFVYPTPKPNVPELAIRPYTYDALQEDIGLVQARFPGRVRAQSIGKSYYGRDIWALTIGNVNATKKIFIQSAIHAREHQGALLAMKQLEYYLAHPAERYHFGSGRSGTLYEILQNVQIIFVPMSNPDGVMLALLGEDSIPTTALKNQVLSMKAFANLQGAVNKTKRDAIFRTWKANGRGVDLNSNFPFWDYTVSPAVYGKWPPRQTAAYTYPRPNGYAGAYALSEPESRALYNFTNAQGFEATLSYHSQGQIIYWYYGQDTYSAADSARDFALVQQLQTLTGYLPMDKASSIRSQGGYKDWFIPQFRKPAFTVELGSWAWDSGTPANTSIFWPQIWPKNTYTTLHLAWNAWK